MRDSDMFVRVPANGLQCPRVVLVEMSITGDTNDVIQSIRPIIPLLWCRGYVLIRIVELRSSVGTIYRPFPNGAIFQTQT
jgi:hypothetical protein